MDRIISTLISIVAAVGGSAGIFIGANKLFDLARNRFDVFGAVAGSLLGFLAGLLMWANRVVTFVEGPIVGAPEPTGFTAAIDFVLMVVANTIVPTAIAGIGGWLITRVAEGEQQKKLILSVGTLGLLGLVFGVFYEEALRAEFDIAALLLWTAIGLAVGAALWAQRGRKRPIAGYLALGGGSGWLLGSLVAPTLGTGNAGWTIVSATVGFAAIGAWIGLRDVADYEARDGISRKSRVYVFLAPALLFIFASLVLPAARTVWLSFLGLDETLDFADRAAGGVDKFVGMDNYKAVFDDPKNFNVENWADVFTSQLTYVSVGLIVLGVIAGVVLGRSRGLKFERSGSSLAPLTLGVFLLSFSIFAVLRGTVFNNLWWVVAVVSLATSLGLAIAVLADRAKMENVAKSLIFMPMAISFVGAGIIWRFVYAARDTSQDQTGVLNSVWVALGQLSNSGWPKTLAALILATIVIGLLYLGWRGYKGQAMGVAIGSAVAALPFLWVLVRLLTIGIGGFSIADDGTVIAETILVRETSPFNNLFLMIVLIWIQTGFTMVIFSAAIKAVPAELVEASKVDGATESQTFWRVTIPQIAPTIGVVITTLIVLVMKVFDIVKVMTNGNFDTQVLANAMFTTAFSNFTFGEGSALAVLIFLSVLPVMYINIRRMQKEAA
ncbi:MAG: ABC transporter permease subunit [bacterium]|nr:ABC transporter permease subunit [bacterium]